MIWVDFYVCTNYYFYFHLMKVEGFFKGNFHGVNDPAETISTGVDGPTETVPTGPLTPRKQLIISCKIFSGSMTPPETFSAGSLTPLKGILSRDWGGLLMVSVDR
jgi:hypothetical protein